MAALNDGNRASILIVDDRPDKLLVYRTLLEELNQNLYTASSGDEALRQVLEREFALILLDVNMPGLDGLRNGVVDPRPQEVGAYAHHPGHCRLWR